MKFCPGVWCPSTILFSTLVLLFVLFFGGMLVFASLYWFFGIEISGATTIPGDVTSIQADHINKSNGGKLVYLTGDTTTDSLLTDPLFGLVVANVIKLRRGVEKFEGQDKGWSKPLNRETSMPKQVKLGAFTLSSGLVDKMPYSQLPMTLELFEHLPDNLSVQLGGKLHLNNGNYYVGQEPAHPQFGDLRIRFSVVSAETVSVIAKQVGSRLVSYRTQTHHDIELLKSGVASMEEVISTHSKKIIPVKIYYFAQFRKSLPFYFFGLFTLSLGILVILFWLKLLSNFTFLAIKKHFKVKEKFKEKWGFFVMFMFFSGFILIATTILYEKKIPIMIGMFIVIFFFLGFYVIVLLLNKLLKYLPFFDNILNLLNWLSALIISVSVILIIIASIWISYLPILGVTLIIMAIGNLYFLKPAHRFLTVPNFELPEEPTLIKETVVPQKT